MAWVAAIVEATATPIAPPSCWVVLSSPEARPASCSATPARAAIETGMNANAVPTPTIADGPARLAQKVPVHGHLGCPQDPAADHGHAGRHHELGRTAGDQRLRQAGEGDRGERRRQPGEAGLQRGVAEHLLHVQGPDEDEGEEAAASSTLDRIRAGDVLRTEDAQWYERRLYARLDDHEDGEQDGGDREQRHRPGRCPTRPAGRSTSRRRAGTGRRSP